MSRITLHSNSRAACEIAMEAGLNGHLRVLVDDEANTVEIQAHANGVWQQVYKRPLGFVAPQLALAAPEEAAVVSE